MKITTYIDEELLKKAMKASQARTKREVLERGLRTVLQETRHREFVKRFRDIQPSWTHDELMRSRG